MRRCVVLVVAVFALCVLAMPQIANAETLGFISDNEVVTDDSPILVGWAQFGPEFNTEGAEGILELVDDGGVGGCANPGVEGTGSDGCEPMFDLVGKIALIDRGCCSFVSKVQNAEAAGALAVLVINDRANTDDLIQLRLGAAADFVDTIGIPSGMITQEDGDTIRYSSESAIARKSGDAQREANLQVWLDRLAELPGRQQTIDLAGWVWNLGHLARPTTPIKASHSQALWNKLAAAFKQYNKGNSNAGDNQMEDFKAQVVNLRADGYIEPMVADTMIAAADMILEAVWL